MTTLSERALGVAIEEAKHHGMAIDMSNLAFAQSSSVGRARHADYLRGCEREGNNIGNWLADTLLTGQWFDFCAAFCGFCESKAATGGDAKSPWRAGALEMMHDCQRGNRPGMVWRSAAQARDELVKPGAIAVFIRGNQGKGHVERVIRAEQGGYWSVGANEGGRGLIRVEFTEYSHYQLAGFAADSA